MSDRCTILQGDCRDTLKTLPPQSVHCAVTSPPYFNLRSYLPAGHPDKSREIGSEQSPQEYVAALVSVFREVWRVLRDDGVLWINLGDSFAADRGGTYMPAETLSGGVSGKGDAEPMRGRGGAAEGNARRDCTKFGIKHKCLIGIPWRVALALQDDGWYLRRDIIWEKRSCMPESVTDRCTTSHEYIFHLTKRPTYYYDNVAIAEPVSQSMLDQIEDGYEGLALKDYSAAGVQDPSDVKSRIIANARKKQKNLQTEDHGRTVHSMHTGRALANGKGFDSSMAGGGSGYYKADGTPIRGSTRNKRSVWRTTSANFAGQHFATFPPSLIKPCILAGTSAVGCCPECAAPYERDTETVAAMSKACPKTQASHEARGGTGTPVGTLGKSGGGRVDGYTTTLGWSPTCKCDAGKQVPCTVLDPFGGSGTTAAVAIELGRKAILCELNAEYIALQRQRIDVTPGLPL